MDTVLILTPLETETHELWSALSLELHDDFNIKTLAIHERTSLDDLSGALHAEIPACIVVVDNKTLQLYRNLQARQPDRDFPPAVVVMTSFLERAIGDLRSSVGIAYEVPLVSSVMALREVAERKVERVGVVYRQAFSEMVEAQAKLAAVEKVELVRIQLPEAPTAEQVEDALDELVVTRKVDAMWALNDNRLLSPEILASSWLPVLHFQPTPVLVGVSALVHPDVHFGTLAVYPNHARLGVQAADLVFELYENDWQLIEGKLVELPLSVTTEVDVAQVDDFFGLKPDALAKVDKAVR